MLPALRCTVCRCATAGPRAWAWRHMHVLSGTLGPQDTRAAAVAASGLQCRIVPLMPTAQGHGCQRRGLSGVAGAADAGAAGVAEGGLLQVEVEGAVATLTLSDQKKRNALSSQVRALYASPLRPDRVSALITCAPPCDAP